HRICWIGNRCDEEAFDPVPNGREDRNQMAEAALGSGTARVEQFLQPHLKEFRPLVEVGKDDLVQRRDDEAEEQEDENGADGNIKDWRHILCDEWLSSGEFVPIKWMASDESSALESGVRRRHHGFWEDTIR